MREADDEVLAELIKPVGFYRRKAKNLVQISKIISEKYDEDIPSTTEEIMELPGIGPKMAHLAMQHAWNMYLCIDGLLVIIFSVLVILGSVSTFTFIGYPIDLAGFQPRNPRILE